MQETYNSVIPNTDEEVKIVHTDSGAKDGQNKCPKCGATEISLNINNGLLRCMFCRYEFAPEKVEELEVDVSKLEGQVMFSGAQDIAADTNDIVTLKCSSCGAEVVIDTSEVTQARCHWCRNTLSINQQVPNGSVPDVILPFSVKKEDARMEIEKFVGKRKFFALKKFKDEFTTENVLGVYFPYMLVDINGHSELIGEGERLRRRYTVKRGDRDETRYDADAYHVEREFDITISNLSVEASADKLDTRDKEKTNNIINSIMPFDVENCVKWNANYIKGYSSEKRDTNVEQLREIVNVQAKDIARFSANPTLTEYDRGVAWSNEQMDVKGQQWKAAYFPVWLYSYQQVKGDKKMLHYVAVNARTKETMGSVPIDMPKLIIMSALIEILSFIPAMLADNEIGGLALFVGVIYFVLMYMRYRNNNARHTYELETKKEISNLRKEDQFLETRKGLSSSRIYGANNNTVRGKGFIKNTIANRTIDERDVINILKNGGKK